MTVVTGDRARQRHPWLRTPDELVDHVSRARWRPAGLTDAESAAIDAWLRSNAHLQFLRDQVRSGRLAGDTEPER